LVGKTKTRKLYDKTLYIIPEFITTVKAQKLSYLIIILAIGVVSILISMNIVSAATITNPLASPASGIAGKGTQYVIKFNATSVTPIKKIVLNFPVGTIQGSTKIVQLTGLGTTSFTTSFTPGQPQLNITLGTATAPTSGVPIFIFLAKVGNPTTSGATNLGIETIDGGGAIIDGPTNAGYTINPSSPNGPTLFVNDGSGKVGIGTSTPAQKLDVIGNIRLTGNVTSPNDICIGSC